MVTPTNQSRTTASTTNVAFGRAERTWNSTTTSWDETPGTWDSDPVPVTNSSRNTASPTNQSAN